MSSKEAGRRGAVLENMNVNLRGQRGMLHLRLQERLLKFVFVLHFLHLKIFSVQTTLQLAIFPQYRGQLVHQIVFPAAFRARAGTLHLLEQAKVFWEILGSSGSARE